MFSGVLWSSQVYWRNLSTHSQRAFVFGWNPAPIQLRQQHQLISEAKPVYCHDELSAVTTTIPLICEECQIAVDPELADREKYLHNPNYVTEYVVGDLLEIDITLLEPSECFDVSRFKEAPASTAFAGSPDNKTLPEAAVSSSV